MTIYRSEFQRVKAIMDAPDPVEPKKPDTIKAYASYSLRVLLASWDESKSFMATVPQKDAEELSLRDWYNMRLRVAQGIAEQVNQIVIRERFR